MPFEEPPPDFPRRRPETYSQYKQEEGTDLKSADLAHYFNGSMFLAGHHLESLRAEIEQSAALSLKAREQILERITNMKDELMLADSIANDTFQLLGNKEQNP